MIKNVESLKFAAKASILNGLRSMEESDSDRVWAEVSRADLSFLVDKNAYRILQQYKDAIPLDNPSAWDSAKGQLKLFASLGIKTDIAQKVIDTIDQRIIFHKSFSSPEQKEKLPKPKHLILFAGHLVDAPNRLQPRFPGNKETQAKKLIKAELTKIIQDREKFHYEGLASAAPGSDILFHEVCQEIEINIPSKICLPMPTNIYSAKIFQDLNDWRSRFLALEDKHEVLELSDRDGLPRWLKGKDKDKWERGNQWVFKMAEAEDAENITLVLLWDRQGQGTQLGGTAHMYRLAQAAGNIDIKIIDANLLIHTD